MPNTYVSQTGNGEVTLKPTVGEEFSGGPGAAGRVDRANLEVPGRPAAPTSSGGSLRVDGAMREHRQTYGSGRSLEFVANFGGATFQHVGFGVDNFQSPNWAMFSTTERPTSFSARTNDGGTTRTSVLPGAFVGSPHRYRIEWDATEVRYFVDGNLVATHDEGLGLRRHPDAPGRERLQLRRPRAVGRLAAHEPLPGVGAVPLACLRRRRVRPTGVR